MTTQHDYSIANQAGAAFRADLNSALAAIVSQNSGTTEPATMFAYQVWADTTSGFLKQRDAANAAWVTLWRLSDMALKDTTFAVVDDGDVTKKVVIQCSGITTGNTRTLAVPDYDGTIATRAGTETLTNKRVSSRTGTTTSSATPTINTDNVDLYSITAQTEAITSFTTNLSGTPGAGDVLVIEITGTAARAITWGASFEASTVALPTTTVSTNMLTVGFLWNAATSKWRCVAAV